jgi:hypothetical protein
MTLPETGYWFNSSARNRIDGDTVSPNALAVLRFTAISKFDGQLDRQIGWLCAMENTAYIGRRAAMYVRLVGPVGKQTAVSSPEACRASEKSETCRASSIKLIVQ